MNNEDQLAGLDRDAKALKSQIELGNALDKLRNNRDFNKLIVDGYLKDEAIRLVHLKADPNMQEPAQQAGIDRDINAIGTLAQYLTITGQRFEIAKKQMADIDDMRTEILREGV